MNARHTSASNITHGIEKKALILLQFKTQASIFARKTMNAVLKPIIEFFSHAPKGHVETVAREHRYDSSRQEKVAAYVLKKHKATLRELAK